VTEQEQRAVEIWLKSNKPKKYPTGYSAIWDEFGNKRAGLKFRLASTAKRVRKVRGHRFMSYVQLSDVLSVDADEIMEACVKHNIVVNE
jgi:hypothetical protein